MLAGRKLLLADDSLTIQKVIELTFADEGVRVIAFGNGDEALDKLLEVGPDIVLADVFMPGKTGYQVCEYIKQNEKLKHIPVMLLVGSFEPFDEAEARRVGADDILTKPFQSIRRLIDRVGALVGGRRPEEEVPTAELPKDAETSTEDDRLNTEELAITTADTQPLPPEWKLAHAEHEQPEVAAAAITGEPRMETAGAETRPEGQFDSDSLLDLGEIEAVDVSAADDFVLELDDEPQNGFEPAAMSYETPQPRAFVEPEITATASPEAGADFEYAPVPQYVEPEPYEHTYEAPVETFEETPVDSYTVEPVEEMAPPVEIEEPPVTIEAATANEQPAPQAMTSGQLSPEMIDTIARRVVEMMSDKVVREVAWDVVPDLAELLIKRQLEEKESQPK